MERHQQHRDDEQAAAGGGQSPVVQRVLAGPEQAAVTAVKITNGKYGSCSSVFQRVMTRATEQPTMRSPPTSSPQRMLRSSMNAASTLVRRRRGGGGGGIERGAAGSRAAAVAAASRAWSGPARTVPSRNGRAALPAAAGSAPAAAGRCSSSASRRSSGPGFASRGFKKSTRPPPPCPPRREPCRLQRDLGRPAAASQSTMTVVQGPARQPPGA